MPQHGPAGTVTPTGWQALGVALVVGAGVGWSAFALVDRVSGDVPSVPLAAAVLIAVLAAVVWVLAVWTHRRIQVRRQPVPPGQGVALLVLGKTCLLGGAALVGAYAAIAVFVARRVELGLPTTRVLGPVVAVVASAAVTVAGGFLERACRIPGPPDEDATPPGIPRSPDTPD
jgi:drug/metabolite transporter (DMT)-like permease